MLQIAQTGLYFISL